MNSIITAAIFGVGMKTGMRPVVVSFAHKKTPRVLSARQRNKKVDTTVASDRDTVGENRVHAEKPDKK